MSVESSEIPKVAAKLKVTTKESCTQNATQASQSSVPSPLTKRDTLTLAVIAAVTLILNSIGLSALEYFRHTEADRTLIAWEMMETDRFMVPHLLHSPILTKPPLYYWLLAGVFTLFGSVSEALARFPSALLSALYAGLHFLVLRVVGLSRQESIFGAVVLVTGASFFVQANLAEIDMLFGTLCYASISLLYLGVYYQRTLITLAAYLVLGLATLAKGPPAVAFFAVAVAAAWWLSVRNSSYSRVKFYLTQLLGVSLALAIVAPWIAAVSNALGSEALLREFEKEVVGRVLYESHHVRGPLFYFGSSLVGFLPWTLLLIPLLKNLYVRISANTATAASPSAAPTATPTSPAIGSVLSPKLRSFGTYHLTVFLAAFLMLTVAQGKSSRYIFPVYGSGSVVFFLLALALYRAGSFSGVSKLWMQKVGRELNVAKIVSILLLIAFGARIGLTTIYAPLRNREKSVQPMVAELNSSLPPGASLYTVEFYERWINYYLKHLGRESYRLTPAEAASPRVAADGRAYLLLSKEEEQWRVDSLKQMDPTMTIVKEFSSPQVPSYLVSVSSSILKELHPHEQFPTVPSRPYYYLPDSTPKDSRPTFAD